MLCLSMITHLFLKNYRNIKLFDSNLSSDNIIIAPNGSGKTNLLEAIFYLFNGISFKSMHSIKDTIGLNEEFSLVKAIVENNIFSVITTKKPETLRVFKKNDKKTNLYSLQKSFKTIIFAPNSVDLIDGPPEIRRNDVDLFLTNIDLEFKSLLNRYNKVLKNKNAILKNIRENNSSRDQLAFWNHELANLGEIIVHKRLDIISKLNITIKNISKIFFDDSYIDIKYINFRDIDVENYSYELEKMFNENIEKEIIVGKTLYGPHKDHIDVRLNKKPLRFYGSRGEQRVGAFTLKLAQAEILSSLKLRSIFLIDDLFSELDSHYKNKISEVLLSNNFLLQTILTSANIEDISKKILQKYNTLKLER